tara:strand:+ start:121 stop:804 length:684 start_codon:yes stop_codon:yes gene_type:complete
MLNKTEIKDKPICKNFFEYNDVRKNLNNALSVKDPFNYWTFDKVLPKNLVDKFLKLPIDPPVINSYSGKRESNNMTRIFFNNENCKKHDCMEQIAEIFNSDGIISTLSLICGKELSKGKLRIEYTLDTGDFWLEPHLDIKEKMLTFLIYLSSDSNTYAKDWGTTIYNKDLTFHSKAPYKQNTGFMFVPGEDTWHGVPKQYIFGVRRNLIINYVSSDWKSTKELYKLS